MNSLKEIKTAIAVLSETEMRLLSHWLQTHLSDRWDQQIAADVSSGKFDRLLQKVNADIEANRIKPLDEIFHDS
ncbi:MAG: hypothetical protein SXA11_16175 [Cyanobacteriota bacterium]|nr:hypothetical protein [Cyanobacteriota bacterium]